MFTQKEIAYAESRPDPKLTLTGIFAAKEALLKAGWSNKGTKDLNKIVISHDTDGRPTHPNFLISISHDEGLAVAVAIKIIEVSNNEAVKESVPDLLQDVVQGSEHSKQISWWQCFLLILISVAASSILQNTSFSSLAFNLFD
jgi:4'-phosphopantetheinyl transferase EntD